jgi:hypothetical protein
VYDEGLTRFASEPYNGTASIKNLYVHLTNYSINKKSGNFVQNQDSNEDSVGHKWSLSALMRHFEEQGIPTDFLWSQIYDLIIKTILTCED